MSLLAIRHIRTTRYHPQSNELVERFHRQLKALLAATARNRTDWSTTLLMILLGIRKSLKEDLDHSSAELFYGTPLLLPGEFLASTPITQPRSIQDYATNLTDTMQKLEPVPPRTSLARMFVSKDLDNCSYVFVRVDGVKKSLQQPYDGPY
ncbi:uncharacterized protein LOC143024395 [Oratosquilla oratoria]|uniref:uncharacterized protein LOC143024395 n=1 Tax=Oratosquilla oratoria TaxID=337810 RepID=UPI003F760CDC